MKQLHELCTEMNELSVFDLEGWAVTEGNYPYGYAVSRRDNPEKQVVVGAAEDLLAILWNYCKFVAANPGMYPEQQQEFARNVLTNPWEAVITPVEMNQAFMMAVDSA